MPHKILIEIVEKIGAFSAEREGTASPQQCCGPIECVSAVPSAFQLQLVQQYLKSSILIRLLRCSLRSCWTIVMSAEGSWTFQLS